AAVNTKCAEGTERTATWRKKAARRDESRCSGVANERDHAAHEAIRGAALDISRWKVGILRHNGHILAAVRMPCQHAIAAEDRLVVDDRQHQLRRPRAAVIGDDDDVAWDQTEGAAGRVFVRVILDRQSIGAVFINDYPWHDHLPPRRELTHAERAIAQLQYVGPINYGDSFDAS